MITIKWFKPLSVAVLSALFLSIVLCVTLTVLIQSTKHDNRNCTSEIETYKKQIDAIQTEKDILMAKLVIAESKLSETGLNGEGKKSTSQQPVPVEPEKLKNNSSILKKKKSSKSQEAPSQAKKDTVKANKPDQNGKKPKDKDIEQAAIESGEDEIINGVDIANLVFSEDSL